MGFELVIAFITHLYTLVTGSNYSAIASSRTLRFTKAYNSSQSAVSLLVFW
jgi:formate hydrogenlyase subunit 4